MKCQHCSAEMNKYSHFCTNCGKLDEALMFSNKELKVLSEQKMQQFLNEVNTSNQTDVEVLWNASVNRYVKSINKIQSILQNSFMQEHVKTNERLIQNMQNYIAKCQSPEFHIAFVGAIKAGKSTLINALLGKQLASTSVTPETAVLTKFRSTKDSNYVRLSFYNQNEWDLLWASVNESKSTLFLEEYNKLNAESEKPNWINHADEIKYFDSEQELKQEIEKWTSSKKATHYFVKEVEVGLVDFKLPEQVVFVDTPGLDDAVKYRSDVTRRYIDRANAVFACVKADAMTGPELATIYRVFANTRYNPEKVYIIGTQWDTINRPEINWKLQKTEWVKYLKQDDCFGNEQMAEKNIIEVASYLYTLAKNYTQLDDDSLFELESIALKLRIRDIEENLAKLIELSNIDYLCHVLSTEIIAKYEQILYQDLEHGYLDLRQDIQSYFAELRNNNSKLLETANQDLETIQAEHAKSQQDLEAVSKQRDSLVNTLNLVRRSTEERVSELTTQIKKLVSK